MLLSDTFSTPQFPCCSFLKIRVVPCAFGEADRIKNLTQLGGVGSGYKLTPDQAAAVEVSPISRTNS